MLLPQQVSVITTHCLFMTEFLERLFLREATSFRSNCRTEV